MENAKPRREQNQLNRTEEKITAVFSIHQRAEMRQMRLSSVSGGVVDGGLWRKNLSLLLFVLLIGAFLCSVPGVLGGEGRSCPPVANPGDESFVKYL